MNLQDKQWSESIQDGNSQSEAELISEYSERIRYFAGRAIGFNDQGLDDLVQNIMIAVIQSLRNGRYDPNRAALSTFIAAIQRNKTNDYLTQKIRHSARIAHPEAGSRNEQIDEIATQPDTTPGPEEQLIRQEEKELYERALASLKPNERLILYLRLSKGLSMAEIAADLNLEPQTVYDLKYKAVAKIKKRIKKLL